MEFPTGTVANIKVMDDLTNLCCKLYCTNLPTASTTGPAFKDELLCHSADLEIAALTLRNSGCLVSTVPNGLGLWVFSGDENFDALNGHSSNLDDASCTAVKVENFNFTCCASGTISISDVAKRIVFEPNSSLFQESIFRTQSGDGTLQDTILQRMITYSAVYAAFVSALSGLLIRDAIRDHGAIPLGKRTLFTAAGLDGCENRDTDASATASTTFLPILDIDFNARGRPIASWRFIPQPGLERLSNEVASWLPFNEDLWLAPTGTICRYVSTVEKQAVAVPLKVQHWKEVLSVWFQKMGLDLQEFYQSVWIEVEMSNPQSYQAGMAEDDGDERNPTSRIFWPATYCFRRAKSEYNIHGPECFQPDFEHPLNFAERWMADSVGRGAPGRLGQPDVEREGPPSKVATPNQPTITAPDTIESLARTMNNPDSNVFQGVYPTPPGGSMPPSVSVAAPEGFDAVTSYVLNNSSGEQTAYHSEDMPSAGLHGDLSMSSQLGVGSGMYDTTAEDDLFREIGDDFNGKGITEADFNFFDDPDFAALPDNNMLEDPPGESNPVAELVPDVPDTQEVHMADSSDQAILDRFDVDGPSGVEGNNTDDAEGAATGPAERRPMSPPLSPTRVKSILSALGTATSGNAVGPDQASHNQYGAVPFQETLSSSDQKYGQSGRFWFNPGQGQEHQEQDPRRYPTDIPLIGHPSRIKSNRQELSHPYPGLMIGDEMNSGEQSPFDSSDVSSDDDSQLSVSMSDEENTPSSYQATGRTKPSALGSSKRETPAIPFDSQEVDDSSTPARCSSLVGSLILRTTDWSFAGYFSNRQSDVAPVLYEASELTLVAQLVADQVTQSSFEGRIDDVMGQSEHNRQSPHAPYPFAEALDFLDMGQQPDIQEYSAVGDAFNAIAKRGDVPVKSPTAPGIFKLDPPYVQIRRRDRYLETLPPAVPFWEIFGLEPLLGPKDIIASCIYPQSAKDDADCFLDRLGSTYSAASFGKHSRSGNDKGLVPWGLGPNGERDYASIMSSLLDTCENLGTSLADLPQSDDNIVIYILNPFGNGAALADICTAFLRLFHKYIEATSRRHLRLFHELVLQVVPLGFVTSPDSLVDPPQSDYLHLSLEVYSRCAPKNPNTDDIGCAPPLALTEPVPKTVPFKLKSEAVSPLENGRCCHIAYSHSIDGRWMTVAWTDSTGRHQTSMSYCLREQGSSMSRPVVEVLADVWAATQDILGMAQRRWQLIVAKDGPMDSEEMTAWSTFAQKQNKIRSAKVELTLLCVDTNPGLFFKIPPSQPQLSPFSQQFAQPSQGNLTPAATPKPGVPSPEPSSSASTPYPVTNLHTPNEQQHQQQQAAPPSHHQPSQQPQQHPQTPHHPSLSPPQDQPTLIDKSDETWSFILSHNLNTSASLSTYRPSDASGYLIRRRGGTSDTEGLASLTVNIMSWQARIPADTLLQNVLRMYRDLATLSRTRGLASARGDCPLPWHIATAARGQEALSYIL